ncbi:MAG: amino acid ABC transporter permease [Cyanobacteria bacterium QS_3_48_167]|nr:MAG: amino acid ABC transporter permease [Cyanobacteria bacterium QS_3_48_167]
MTHSSPSTSPKSGIVTWLRQNLFSTWYNSLLTVICLVGLFLGLRGLLVWAIAQAQWGVIAANLPLFFVGRYPDESYWRLWIVLGIILTLIGISWGINQRSERLFNRPVLVAAGVVAVVILFLPLALVPRLWLLTMLLLLLAGTGLGNRFAAQGNWLYLAWLLSFPIILWLIAGGLGWESVESDRWTGLLLTLLTAVVSIVLSFPIGVLLALGRQSELPVVRLLSILYIEIVRGLPLIGILFLALVMLPLFLPAGVQWDRVVRAIAGLTLFSAAYLAENVRGGLQAVPPGQVEAAKALGLKSPLITMLIVLPQALKAVTPALVGQFIGLFKNTSLLSLVGLVELVGISRSILANPNYLGRYAEVYLFVGVIYWIFCYGMSFASRRLEKKLNIE